MARKRAGGTSNSAVSSTPGGLKSPVVVEARPAAPAKPTTTPGSTPGAVTGAVTGATTTKTSGTTATLANAPKARPTHDMIAKRAYEIWIAKGRPTGKDLENWQQAERELCSKA